MTCDIFIRWCAGVMCHGDTIYQLYTSTAVCTTSCNYVSYRVSYHTTAVCYFEVFETKRLLLFDAAMLMVYTR